MTSGEGWITSGLRRRLCAGGLPCPQNQYGSGKNQLTYIGTQAIGYDAAGYQLNDQFEDYQYDAEGRVKSSTCISGCGSQYVTYNALGQRVQDYQSDYLGGYMTLTYPRDIFGDRTGIWDDRPSQNWLGWDIFWARVAGQRLNMGGGSAFIDHADAIGSTVMETDPSGAAVWDVVNGPWGQAWQQTGTRQSAVFAGLDWQVNDPLIPSPTREYSDGLGRWMTPDPDNAGSDVGDSQSWNMYAYVTDNPTTLNDPSGFAACSYTNLSACFGVENNAHASASEENSSHQSAPGVNSEQNTITVTYTSGTTTHDSAGNVIATTTTVTANFEKKTGKFMSATTETTSETISADALSRNVVSSRTRTEPQSLTAGQFTNFLNGQGEAVDPGAAVWYAGAQAHDITTHPGRYAIDVAVLAAAPALGLEEAAEGIITAIHALHSAYELQKEVGVGGVQ